MAGLWGFKGQLSFPILHLSQKGSHSQEGQRMEPSGLPMCKGVWGLYRGQWVHMLPRGWALIFPSA